MFVYDLRYRVWKPRLRQLGAGTKFERYVVIRWPDRVSLGRSCHLSSYCRIEGGRGWPGTVTFGDNCTIGEFSIIAAYGGKIAFGDSCSINAHCVIYGHGGLTAGSYVRIASHTVLIPANHVTKDRSVPIMQQGLTRQGIVIGDDVWIGVGVSILDGVTIGHGSVVGAGSVVTKSIPEYQVWAGVPARRIGFR